MQIYGPFRVSTTPVNASPTRSQTPTPSGGDIKRSQSPVDQLELSNAGSVNRMDATGPATTGGDIRFERVAEIRRQIANGTYDTDDKLDLALDRLLDQFA
jgi:negative regulator of flagellin synthesis FlgM